MKRYVYCLMVCSVSALLYAIFQQGAGVSADALGNATAHFAKHLAGGKTALNVLQEAERSPANIKTDDLQMFFWDKAGALYTHKTEAECALDDMQKNALSAQELSEKKKQFEDVFCSSDAQRFLQQLSESMEGDESSETS